MGAMQQRKGAGGEREFAGLVADLLGVRLVRRLDQWWAGGHDLAVDPSASGPAADVLRGCALEIKRRAVVSDGDVTAWWQQTAQNARRARLLPVLVYRGDRRPWRVVMAIDAVLSGLPKWAGDPPHLLTTTPEVFAVLVREGLLQGTT